MPEHERYKRKLDLYGIWLLLDAKADITSPRAESDRLIF